MINIEDWKDHMEHGFAILPCSEACKEGLRNYFYEGKPAGDFLMAVLRNDLMDVCGRADIKNQRILFEYCRFLYNSAPHGSYGSSDNVKNWLINHPERLEQHGIS